jgi:excisionase family DNA binding protein
MQKLLYTTTEAKAVIGCGTTRLYELINSGELEARRLGHRTMIEAESLRELVDSLPRVTTPTMRRRASGDTEPKRVV